MRVLKPIWVLAGALFCAPLIASTPDGQTPSREVVCSGLSGSQYGICNAYCEAMDCDSPNHKASNKACQNKIKQWDNLMPNQAIPCESRPSILLVKEVNKGIDGFIEVGNAIVYKFTITNTGNVPLSNITLEDDKIPVDSLSDCRDNVLNGLVLEVNQSVQCTTDGSPQILAQEDTQTNTATVSGKSLYGEQTAASAEATYIGEETSRCPCSGARLKIAAQTWNQIIFNGIPATQWPPDAQACHDIGVAGIITSPNGYQFFSPYSASDNTSLSIGVSTPDQFQCRIAVQEDGVMQFLVEGTDPGNKVGPCAQAWREACEQLLLQQP